MKMWEKNISLKTLFESGHLHLAGNHNTLIYRLFFYQPAFQRFYPLSKSVQKDAKRAYIRLK